GAQRRMPQLLVLARVTLEQRHALDPERRRLERFERLCRQPLASPRPGERHVRRILAVLVVRAERRLQLQLQRFERVELPADAEPKDALVERAGALEAQRQRRVPRGDRRDGFLLRPILREEQEREVRFALALPLEVRTFWTS